MGKREEILVQLRAVLYGIEGQLMEIKKAEDWHRERAEELHVLTGEQLANMYGATYELKQMMLDRYKQDLKRAERL